MTLSNSITNGKKDWKKMMESLKTFTNEAVGNVTPTANQIANSGNTATPSDTSPNAEIVGGKFDTIDKKLDTMASNIKSLGDTPEYKKFREENDISISKDEKNIILSFLNSLKVSNLVKDKDVANDEQILDTIELYNEHKNSLVSQINKKIKEFNNLSADAVKKFGGGGGGGNLSAEFRDIPSILSLDDFKNTIKTVNGKHILSVLLPMLSQKIEEAFINNKYVDPREKTNAASADPSKDTTGDTISRFVNWLIRGVGAQGSAEIIRKNMITKLAEIMQLVKKLEVDETVIDGFKLIIARIQKFKEMGKKGNLAKLKFKNMNPKTQDEINSAVEELENHIETTANTSTGVGPGKIADVNMQPVNESVLSCDKINKKLNKINNGWNIYKQKNNPNKEKPNGFNIVIG